MKFKVPKDFFNERLNNLKRFITKQELNALLVSDDEPIEVLLAELTDTVPINDLEAYAFLLKLREISCGEDIEFIVTCDTCQTMNNPRLPIEECFNDTTYQWMGIDVPRGPFLSPASIINIEDMDKIKISDYKELEGILFRQAEEIVKLHHRIPCRKCGNTLNIVIDPRKVFSKTSLAGIYQDYLNISMFSNNGKLDIDALYPFEREIYQSLIEEKLNPDKS